MTPRSPGDGAAIRFSFDDSPESGVLWPEYDRTSGTSLPADHPQPSEGVDLHCSALETAGGLRRAEESASLADTGRVPAGVVVICPDGSSGWLMPFPATGLRRARRQGDAYELSELDVRPPEWLDARDVVCELRKRCKGSSGTVIRGAWLVRYTFGVVETCWVTPDCTGSLEALFAPPEIAAPAAAVSDWLMDTGSGNDLLAESQLGASAVDLEPCTEPVLLNTANGLARVERQVPLDLLPLGESASALVLQSTPPVLSIGKRVMDLGYSFLWGAGRQALMVRPDGLAVDCHVEGNIPYMSEDAQPRKLTKAERRACHALGLIAPAWLASQAKRRKEPQPSASTPAEGRVRRPSPEGPESGRASSSGLERHSVAAGHGRGDAGGSRDVAGDPGSSVAPPVPEEEEESRAPKPSFSEHDLTHYPVRADCPVCQHAVRRRVPRRRFVRPAVEEPTEFGQEFTVDHLIPGGYDEWGLAGESYAVTCLDRYTGYVDCIPVLDKTAEEAARAIWEVLGGERPSRVYTDRSLELKAAMRSIKEVYPEVRHHRSFPYRPSSNGRVERANHTVVQGTRAVLWAAGAPISFWSIGCRYYCMARNTAVVDGESAWQKRHGEHFRGKRIPFGAKVRYLPEGIPAEERAKFNPRMSDGIFAGWELQDGAKWAGAYLVLPWSTIRDLDYVDPVPPHYLQPVLTQVVQLAEGPLHFPLVPRRDHFRFALTEEERRGAWLDEPTPEPDAEGGGGGG